MTLALGIGIKQVALNDLDIGNYSVRDLGLIVFTDSAQRDTSDGTHLALYFENITVMCVKQCNQNGDNPKVDSPGMRVSFTRNIVEGNKVTKQNYASSKNKIFHGNRQSTNITQITLL